MVRMYETCTYFVRLRTYHRADRIETVSYEEVVLIATSTSFLSLALDIRQTSNHG